MTVLVYDVGVYDTDTYGLNVPPVVTPGDVKPPLELHAELVAPDGTRHRWASERTDPGQRPQGVSFASKRFEGWERGSCALSRPPERDYPDLGLFDGFNLIGYDGTVAYEGMLGQVPRSTPFDIGVEATGWMAHARHRKFREVYVHQLMSDWHEAPLFRQAELAVAGNPQAKIQAQAGADGIVFNIPNEAVPQFERKEMWYEAPPGVTLKMAAYIGVRTGAFTSFDAPTLNVTDRPDDTPIEQYALSLTNSVQVQAFTTARRKVFLLVRANTAVTPAAGDQERYSRMAVYGNHSVPEVSVFGEPYGYYASDLIKDICSRWCPRLNTGGVQATTWPVPQAAWHDRTDPYDAWLELNKFHLWELAVWEDRTLHYGPSDLTDYDWQVRTTDPGVQVSLQGDSTDHLANYCVVQFQNSRTGEQDEVSPDTHPELRDLSVENPANRHGLNVEFGISLSDPTDADSAAQIGRVKLAENNQPKAIGTITFKGHIRDRAGHWQQGWKVRASDTVAITDWPNNRPRLIGEVAWDHTSKTGTIAVDSTLPRIDAYLDRFGTQLRAQGLSS